MKKKYITLLVSSVLATGLTLSDSANAFSIFSGSISGETGFYYYDDAGTLLGKRDFLSTNTPATGTSFFADFDLVGNELTIEIENTTGQGQVTIADWTNPFLVDETFGAGATEASLVGLAIDLLDPSTRDNTNLITPGTALDTLTNNNIEGGSIDSTVVDVCVANDTNCQGGNANQNIGAGQSDMFTLALGGSPIPSEQDYLNAYLNSSQGLVARFQQVNGGDNKEGASDKTYPGGVIDDDDPNGEDPENQDPTDIPEPGTILGLSLFTLAAAKFTKKKK